MSDSTNKIVKIRDRRWVQVGSDDWNHEVMQAINELIDRCTTLEDRIKDLEHENTLLWEDRGVHQ